MADNMKALSQTSNVLQADQLSINGIESNSGQYTLTNESVVKFESDVIQSEIVAIEEIAQEEEEEDQFQIMVTDGLSQLGRSADGTMQVFLSLSLQHKDLQTIEELAKYTHLQVLDLSYNELRDLSTLSNLPHLISLDASHNELSDVLDFKPPLTLREVNLSHNKISYICDLSMHKCLKKLILDNNFIKEISDLHKCERLKTLSLADNQIEKIAGLENLPLTYLGLSKNKLKKIENIDSLRYLQVLDLSFNFIRSLKGLQSHNVLDTIRLSNNEIIDLSEVRYIRDLPLLRALDFSSNPIQDFPDYRLSILFRIPRLTELDGSEVLPEEKVASENLFKPSREIVAARNHMMNLLNSYQQPIRLYNSTLSSIETPYPMLILTGPSGSGKRSLVKRLCQEFPNFFGQGVSFTTRGLRENETVPRESEIDGIDYYFVTKDNFEKEAIHGKFIETCTLYNNQYGISRETIEMIAKEGLACVFHMELEGVMVLKNSHFEPRYVLVLPETSKVHEERMRASQFYNDSHIREAIERVSLYEDTNREHPGYFDMTIFCDDMEDSYRQLKRIVLEYLGLTPVNSTISNLTPSAHESDLSDLSSTDVTHSASTTYGKETPITGSPLKPWSRTRVQSRGQDSRGHNSAITGSGKSPVEAASIQRRFKRMQAATIGITSTSKDQLAKLRIPLSANAVHYAWETEDPDELPSSKRANSAPNGLGFSFQEPFSTTMEENEHISDDSDSEMGSVVSDMSSAHAGYMDEEVEDGSISETSRTSLRSVLS